MVATRKCFLANFESEMRDFQDLQTDLRCMRDLTGSLERISATMSNVRLGSGGSRSESPGGMEEEDDDTVSSGGGSDEATLIPSSAILLRYWFTG